ncbi:MAG: arginine--tRNA ligase [Bacteroidales bacterium]|jgi:arginyl-tRNA synthetase|nr:arginine--tRNA ligase [Bacteroidales bacterium]
MLNNLIQQSVSEIIFEKFNAEVSGESINIQKTDTKFDGDVTIVVFPFVKMSRKSPEETGKIIGEKLLEKCPVITGFNIVKGFLNLTISDEYYINAVQNEKYNSAESESRGKDCFDYAKSKQKMQSDTQEKQHSAKKIVIEYSSPNTNKPLHLGHIRNNLLGWSVCEILKEVGYDVVKVNLVNDRGIHICKSMLAWQKFGNGETPESSGLKGDHLVGKYYVIFDKEYKRQTKEIAVLENISEEDSAKKSPILLEAQEMLRQWEHGDAETVALWKKMNAWVYQGFDATYKRLGVDFDKVYYESETYLLGKDVVLKGLKDSVLYQREDSSVWADLRNDGLDEKLLLRKDGTSVYMTQDLGTAILRMNEFHPEKMIYVVGNEQNYHFDVLKIVLKKLGYTWADNIFHLSYGMVELPEGKMKSREGTVVDADDLIDGMVETAKETAKELGKMEDFDSEEAKKLFLDTALAALKYFILKVDPVKNMLFNPKESIDFNGSTGPFIQYTHARICSLLNKCKAQSPKYKLETGYYPLETVAILISNKEKSIIKILLDYEDILQTAAQNFSPAVIANYIYDLAKEYNSFYQDMPILKERDENIRNFRLILSQKVAETLKIGLRLLGIHAPEKM